MTLENVGGHSCLQSQLTQLGLGAVAPVSCWAPTQPPPRLCLPGLILGRQSFVREEREKIQEAGHQKGEGGVGRFSWHAHSSPACAQATVVIVPRVPGARWCPNKRP